MEVEEFKIWDEFVVGQKPVQFLQSWQWGQFQQNLGRQIFRLKGEWGQALIVKYHLPLGKSYLYCPRGPVLRNWDDKRMVLFLAEVKNLAKKEESIFLRFEPPILDSRFRILDSRRAADVQPSKTLILDLSKSEEELLAAMHYKTRYNIRLAQKHEVKIFQDNNQVENFLNLLHQTIKRDKFRAYPDRYYHQLLNLNPEFVKLYLARFKEKILTANIIIFFGDTVTYVHGASSDEYKNLMAPHLLHWEIICLAKKLGYQFYDFWGINEKKWPGVTRFKKSFGGQIVEYPGAFDLVLDKFWYRLYCLGKRFRNW